MRLFSEKVVPTFTSSNQNILTVKDYSEIFFDVFELEINGNKYIAEKVSEYKGNPVVNIPIVIEGRELEAPFVLQRGILEVIFNESNSTFLGPATSRPEEVFIEAKSQEEEVEEIIFEKKESILKEIQQARKLAGEYATSIKKQNLQEAAKAKHKEREIFFKSKEKFKADLIEEFLQLSNVTRDELFEYTEQENEKAYNFIVESINSLSDKLTQDLESTLQEQNTQSIELFESRISELAQSILAENLLKEITSNNNNNNKAIDAKFETVAKTLTKVLNDYEQSLNEKVETTLTSYDGTILTLEQSNVELSDAITKTSNKALSRIGNVKTQLEGAIINTSIELAEGLTNKITLAESRIKDYYDERITLIETSVTDITAADKAHILEIIEESKQSILREVDLIKGTVPTLVNEKTSEAKGDVDIKLIKTDLEKSISNRFTQELANVRRIIELSSGGGSVATQFANGGIMNGDLNVTGNYFLNGVNLIQLLSSTPAIPNKLINGTYEVTLSSDGYLSGPSNQWSIDPLGNATFAGGNITLSDSGLGVITITTDYNYTNFLISKLDNYDDNGYIGTITIGDFTKLEHLNWYISPDGTNNLTNISGTINQITVSKPDYDNNFVLSLPDSIIVPGDININGSLYIAGSSVQINTSNLSVADSLIYMATANTSNLLDIGIVGHFTSSYYQHTGLVKNHNTGKWTLFSGVTSEPLSGANTINLDGPDLIIDTLRSNIEGNITGTTTANLSVAAGDQKAINFITNNNTKVIITSAGNVGIGTTTPTQKLDVVGAIQTSSNLFVGGSIIYMNQQQALLQGANSLTLGNAAYWTSLRYGHTSTTTHSFLAGNVGIGTTTPLNSLHVVGKDAASGSDFIALFQEPGIIPEASSTINTAADRAVMVQGAGGAFYLGRDVTNGIEFAMGTSILGEAFAGAMTNHNFSLRTNNANRLTILTNGNVGIGTTTPSQKLSVSGNVSVTGSISATNINTSGDIEFSDLARGVILKSPDSSRWRITINDNGALTTTKL